MRTSPVRVRWYLSLSLAVCAPAAGASGLEVPDNGTVALGRGDAFVARASDPTALIHNPAGLAGLPGLQLILGTNIGSFSHCFQRQGNYASATTGANINTDGTVFSTSQYANGHTAYPEVCNNPSTPVVPHFVASYQINRYVTVALGAYGPNTTGAVQNFPDRVNTPSGLAPSPAINLLYEKNLFLVHISAGVAVALTPWLRIGAVIQPSYANFSLATMSNSAATFAQSPDSDVHLAVNTSGFFMAGNLGIQVLPSRYLSFGLAAHLNASADLHGTGDTVANYYATNAAARTASSFSVDHLTVSLPWTLRAGARFALPRFKPSTPDPAHPAPAYDPMVDDIFDLEAVFSTETTSMMSVNDLRSSGTIQVGAITVNAPAHVVLDSHLNDVYGVRVGGDLNVLPGRLAVRAGFSYDTGAETSANAQIHLPGYESLGIHGGASLRVGFLTASVAYAHTFMSGLDASDGNHTVISTGGTITPANCAGGAGDGACHINQGQYTAHLDLFSASLAARF